MLASTRDERIPPRVGRLDARAVSAVKRRIARTDDAIARTELSPPVESESGRLFLQQRIALLARVELVLGLLVQAQTIWLYAFSDRETNMALWKVVSHLFVLAIVVAIWWRTRTGARSQQELYLYDVLCVALPPAFWCFAMWDAPPEARPSMMLVFAATNILIIRSVLVPSQGRRTALIGAGLIVLVATWSHVFRTFHPLPGDDAPWVGTVVVAMLCLLGVVIATVASHTIFGLRQAVRRAMQLGQYTLIRKIGEGGMGVVWEAKHALLRRRTAVKLLPAERAGEDAIARFEREVQLTSTLTHPNTIAIYDYGRSADGVFYYAMEHLDGIDLQALVERDGPQSPGLVAHVLAQLCEALAEAHGVALIHRDIKPANVFLCERGGVPLVAKVLDFGLVKRVETGSAQTELSAANVVVGTPLYMAPEVVTAPDRVDARSDLYSVGALGYFLLTGKSVFEGGSALEVFALHMHGKVVPPSERASTPIPKDLEAIVLACLEKNPDLRPPSAAELARELAATSAWKSFDADAAKVAWVKCRSIAQSASPATPEPTRMTVQLAVRS